MKESDVNILINEGELNPDFISDGHHTFKELYQHRFTLFIALCNVFNQKKNLSDSLKPWKSKKHFDGTMYNGWFVAGIGLRKGEQITYHIPLELWDSLDVLKRPNAPEWDGHTSQDVVERLSKIR